MKMFKVAGCILFFAISPLSMAANESPAEAQTAMSAYSIRTERYPRPPSSGATYFIYEKDGKVICTKLAVCDKYDSCKSTYARGSYKAPEDVKAGNPYGTTPAVLIQRSKLTAHKCLLKFDLNRSENNSGH
ncbi:hypothetical protein [Rhodanobacter sp. L36]|uniref:hypothetical protein n=1 Tax=Rhodanobacter sp. L36 TaxID=1747221 RepID=UPI001C20B05A|nr:hypothetical protein [Rhodanobacter sp. L36]